jgi:hypothetical protein
MARKSKYPMIEMAEAFRLVGESVSAAGQNRTCSIHSLAVATETVSGCLL